MNEQPTEQRGINMLSYEETIYLLNSKKNANRLLESINRIKAGQTTKRNLIENDRQDRNNVTRKK